MKKARTKGEAQKLLIEVSRQDDSGSASESDTEAC